MTRPFARSRCCEKMSSPLVWRFELITGGNRRQPCLPKLQKLVEWRRCTRRRDLSLGSSNSLRDLRWRWKSIVARISNRGDVRASAHIVIEDHLVLLGRESLGEDCCELTCDSAVSIHDGEERAGAASIPSTLIIIATWTSYLAAPAPWLNLPWLHPGESLSAGGGA